jgi:hypothetical protein
VDLAHHLRTKCVKREVLCPLCEDINLQLWAEELANHMKTECLKRPTECQLKCGIQGQLMCNGSYNNSIELHII